MPALVVSCRLQVFYYICSHMRDLVNIAIILATLLWTSPALQAQVNAEQVINIGRNVMSMDDYMLSIQYFNQAIKAKPYLAEPYFYRALAKLQLEDYKGAEADATLSLQRNKFRTETYRLRGFARQVQGLDSLAITDYVSGLRYNPRDKYMLYYKGVAETETGRYDDADSTFHTLLEMYPHFEEGLAGRGRLNAVRGDTAAAIADLDLAIANNALNTQTYLLRAELNTKLLKWEEALKDMDNVIRLQPRESDLYLNRAFVRYNLDDFFGAMSDYNYALELNPGNEAALFNRALLRYEVKDLDRSAADLTEVLKMDPTNFHARFNLGLVNLQRKKPREAAVQFAEILKRYPRYHNGYYAMAEAYRDMGDMRSAMSYARQGDDLVRKYVHNPTSHPLDRPAIQSGLANAGKKARDNDDEDENEVMDRFNRLVTVSASDETSLSYDDKIKGRVQDRDMNIQPLEGFSLTFAAAAATLDNKPVYFREMDDFNNRGWAARRLYLVSGPSVTEQEAESLFALATSLDSKDAAGTATAADYLSLGVARSTLKDYEAAVKAFNKALGKNASLATAYVGRADALLKADSQQSRLALADYDKALDIDPRLAFAWLNKGNIYYDAGDFTSAIECYTKALQLDGAFGAALYNRGLTYLRIGNRRLAFADLSKAGELGVLPSYNLLKRMK